MKMFRYLVCTSAGSDNLCEGGLLRGWEVKAASSGGDAGSMTACRQGKRRGCGSNNSRVAL